jgi:hypothetical protein
MNQPYTIRKATLADRDGTFFVVESVGVLRGCGGRKRRTLCGDDQFADRDDAMLDAQKDGAKIRAVFIHPNAARQ